MYCIACGALNDENAYHCISCGQLLRSQSPIVIPSYLAPAILVTIFCCLPFGIPAIVYAAQVNAKASAGQFAEAKNASDKAKMWCWVSFACGMVGVGLWFLGALGQLAAVWATHH
jgi:hypothetical protein